MGRVLVCVLLLLAGSTAAAAPSGGFVRDASPAAPADPFAFIIDVAPERIAPGQGGVITVSARIPPGHKLYADRTSIIPGAVPGMAFGRLDVPGSVERTEPDGNTARFHVADATFRLPVSVEASAPVGSALVVPLTIRYQGCAGDRCFFPQEKRFAVTVDVIGSAAEQNVSPAPAAEALAPPPSENPYWRAHHRFGLMGVLAAAFVWGLLASLTPCIYPMIPITMTVIGAAGAGSAGRGFGLSLIYVAGMSLVYAAFGVAAAWSGALFGGFAGHPAVRIGVAVIFTGMALSLFDLFHVRMPVWAASRIGRKFGGGGVGVFLTGAAAGAVVGPCVGPLLVALLVYVATLGDRLQGFLIMWSFALGMGTLFVVIGTFSGAAAALPRSGSWMERLKRSFGALMLAAALYYAAPLMPDRILWLFTGALLIGIGVFMGALDGLTAAAGGYDRLRKSVGILCLALGVAYAARFALTGAGVGGATGTPTAAPGGIAWMTDEAAALAAAHQGQRPVLIDFYADWCAACKDLDRKTFADPRVVATADRFVALRVDSSDPSDPEAKALHRKYGVVGLPTLVFIDRTGRIAERETVTQFIAPEALLERMGRF